MKRIILLVVLATICVGAMVFAQQFTNESNFYYFNYPIERIYAHRLGYMIIYRGNSNIVSRTFVPHEWFTGIGSTSKGEIIYLGPGNEWPSMTVYYDSGDFSHVRLKLRRDRSHETWATFPQNVNVDEYFQDIQEVELEY